jgi:hypothetical protein
MVVFTSHDMSASAPSSSGPGRQVLILKIAGSTPAGVTTKRAHRKVGFFRGVSEGIQLQDMRHSISGPPLAKPLQLAIADPSQVLPQRS